MSNIPYNTSTSPKEAISNANLLLSNVIRDITWRVHAKAEIEQIDSFIAQGLSRLETVSDRQTHTHIRMMIADLEWVQTRLKNAVFPGLDDLVEVEEDDWARPTQVVTKPSQPTIMMRPVSRTVEEPIPAQFVADLPNKGITRSNVLLVLLGIGVLILLGNAARRNNTVQVALEATSLPIQSQAQTLATTQPVIASTSAASNVAPGTTAIPGGMGYAASWNIVNGIYRLHVHNIEFTNQFGTSSSAHADAGNIYVAFDVEITALSPTTPPISKYEFFLKDFDNFEYEAELGWVREPALKSRESGLSQGTSTRGWVTFEIPETQLLKLSMFSYRPYKSAEKDWLVLQFNRK